MPTHKQGTVEPVITTRDLGRSGTNDLRTMYATSPINKGDLTPDAIRMQYQEEVLDGITNDGGHTFGEFDKSYTDAPDYGDVPTGGEGLPASPFVPNPSSPGEGSVNPSAQPSAPDGFGSSPSDTPFVGVGSQLSPKASSEKIAGQTLGDYGLGKSSK